MGTEKTKLLTHKPVYWINISTDIENTVKLCATHMKYQQTQLHEKAILYMMSHNPREVCIVDYYSKFKVIEKTDGLSADGLIRAVKTLLQNLGCHRK